VALEPPLRSRVRVLRGVVLLWGSTLWIASLARADTPAPRVLEVRFEGIETFTSRRLVRFLETRPTSLWYRRRFDPVVFDRDLENVQRFYRDEGFLAACVWAGRLDWNADSTGVRPTVRVREGPRWQVARLEIAGGLPLPFADAGAALELHPAAPFRPVALDRDQRALQSLCARAAFLDARVEPRVAADGRLVTLAYDVQLGDPSSCGAITITGNGKTRPHVVRRELGFGPESPLASDRVADAHARLLASGLFDRVTIAVMPGQEGRARKDVEVAVVERTSRDASIGAGFATTEGARLRLQLRERNLRGNARRVGLDGRISARRRIAEGSFTDPWLGGTPLALDLVAAYDWQDEPGFTVEALRGSASVRRRLGRRTSADAGIRFARNHLLESRAEPARAVPRNRVGRLIVGYERDTRDDLFDTRRGGFVRVETGAAGSALGSGQPVFTAAAIVRRVIPLSRRWRVAIACRHDAAWLQEGGLELPIENRFYAGGDGSVRGFARHAVGPHDAAGNPLGGNHRSEGSVELRCGVHRRLDLVGFGDAGQVTRYGRELRLDAYEVGLGGGLHLRTPWGLLRADVAVPVRDGGTTRAHFAVGQPF